MTTQRIAIGLIAFALFVGSMTAYAVNFSAESKAYLRYDYATALRIFRQLADQDDIDAQTFMGIMYALGQGVKQDYREAAKWYRKAALQGDAIAQTFPATGDPRHHFGGNRQKGYKAGQYRSEVGTYKKPSAWGNTEGF